MGHWLVVATATALLVGDAAAAPRADVIVVWAPQQDVAPIAAVARAQGIALIDRSPPSAAPPPTDATIKRGIDAYDALQLDAAWNQFEEARAQLDATGGAGATNARISDLFVYRSLIKTQRGDVDGAWEELVAATAVAPARVFDPVRFPPRTLGEIDRARKAATAARVTVAIDAPADCVLALDGTPAAKGEHLLARGVHWLAATCPASTPWDKRIEITDTTTAVKVEPQRIAPPSEVELLVQARTAGARAVVIVEVKGKLAVARLVGLDGKERDRRSTAITTSLDPAAAIVGELLVPKARPKWHESRWVWAAGGALALAAVLVPVFIIVSEDQPSGVKIGGPGELPP